MTCRFIPWRFMHPGADGPALTGVLRQQSPDGRCRLEFCYHLVRAWQWDTEAILAGGMDLLPLASLECPGAGPDSDHRRASEGAG